MTEYSLFFKMLRMSTFLIKYSFFSLIICNVFVRSCQKALFVCRNRIKAKLILIGFVASKFDFSFSDYCLGICLGILKEQVFGLKLNLIILYYILFFFFNMFFLPNPRTGMHPAMHAYLCWGYLWVSARQPRSVF